MSTKKEFSNTKNELLNKINILSNSASGKLSKEEKTLINLIKNDIRKLKYEDYLQDKNTSMEKITFVVNLLHLWAIGYQQYKGGG